jgi:hypothetical protein
MREQTRHTVCLQQRSRCYGPYLGLLFATVTDSGAAGPLSAVCCPSSAGMRCTASKGYLERQAPCK